MNLIILLFAVGVLFMFLEVFTPGPVFGILGAATLVGGVAAAALRFGGVGGLLSAAVAVVAVCLTLYAELSWLPRTRFAQKFSVRGTSGSTLRQQDVAAEAVVGKNAVAVTTLAPSGYVTVEGRRYEAFCENGHVERGSPLRVTGLDNFRLIVSKISTS